MPIDPSMAVSGGEWRIGLDDVSGSSTIDAPAAPAEGGGFGGALAEQIGKLGELQNDAAQASRDLATGTATDPAETVMAVERARLAMQLASTLRTKGVEAIQDVFHTQV